MALDPGLRLGLADPRGNVYPNLDTITVAELAEALGVSGGTLNILYQGLATFGTVNTGINDGDNILAPLAGFASRSMQETQQIFWSPGGAVTAMTLQGLNGRRWGQIKCGVAQGGLWQFRPGAANAQNPISFADVFPPLVPGLGTPLTTISPSVKIEALFRKLNAGDATDCRCFFGFVYTRILSPSAQVTRIGMIGDGALGYGFGSVNCPDGLNGGGANAPGDRDANFVQPAGLVTPGTSIWKVGVKLVPPTPTQTGRWGAYLNDVLVATYTTTVNFPRGLSNPAPIDDGYRAIEAGFGYLTDGVALAGPLISDPMVTVAFDWSL